VKIVRFEPTFEAWREAARPLLGAHIDPSEIEWVEQGVKGHVDTLFDTVSAEASENPEPQKVLFPAKLMESARFVACHANKGKWALLYHVFWQVLTSGRAALEDSLENNVLLLERMRREVWIEVHHMHAYVRFQKTFTHNQETYVAWYHPHHPVLRLAIDFFARRFAGMHWAILTPVESAYWNGVSLTFGPGCPQNETIADDAAEDLWRTYFSSIFNPARLNVRQLKHKIPPRVWQSLPEGKTFSSLIFEAPSRVDAFLRSSAPSALPYLPQEPADWNELKETARACRGCPLWQQSTKMIFGEGAVPSKLVILGEQPGDSEDFHGRVFCGPAGTVLDEALLKVGLNRNDIYLTNAVKHFKHEKIDKKRIHRTPGAKEVAACRPWLEEEIKRVSPQIIVCLGQTAAHSVLGHLASIQSLRGQWHTSPWGAMVLVTYHPAAVLRAKEPDLRKEIEGALVQDLQKAKEYLNQNH
jgi:uracil-DNA glycosylase